MTKNYIISYLKESIKFALMAVALFLFVGILSLYILIEILKIDTQTSIISVGIITAVIIVIVDEKITHFKKNSFEKMKDMIDHYSKVKINKNK